MDCPSEQVGWLSALEEAAGNLAVRAQVDLSAQAAEDYSSEASHEEEEVPDCPSEQVGWLSALEEAALD